MKAKSNSGPFIIFNVKGRVALSIWLCHIAVAAFFYWRTTHYHLRPYYWASLLVLVSSLPYLLAAAKDSFVPYEGVYLFLGGLLVGFTSYIFLPPDSIFLDRQAWTAAMKLATFGTISFLIGYYLLFGKAISKVLPIRRFIVSDMGLVKLPVRFYFIGWALRLFPFLSVMGIMALEHFGIIGIPTRLLIRVQGWEITNMLTTYGICAALLVDTYLYLSVAQKSLEFAQKRQGILTRLLFFFSLELIYGFFSGMAGTIIRPVILLSFVYIKAKKRIPVIPIIIITLFFLFYVVPFMKLFRQQYWQGAMVKNSIEHALQRLSDEEVLTNKKEQVLRRLSNPLEMAVICYRAREEGRKILSYRDMPEYISRFVPRFLWPNKPSLNYNEIGKEIGILNPNDHSTSISLTLVGGLIIDHGPTGVIIGMFFSGLIVSILWNWLVIRSEGNAFAFSIYAVLIYRLIFPDDFYSLLHATITFIIYAYFLIGLVNRPYYKRLVVTK